MEIIKMATVYVCATCFQLQPGGTFTALHGTPNQVCLKNYTSVVNGIEIEVNDDAGGISKIRIGRGITICEGQ